MANRNRPEVRTAVHRRIRRKVRGTTARPRLAVYRSLNHIYAQVIDDETAKTLASASTTEKTLRTRTGGNIDAAKRVGQAIAERALAAGIEQVVFDRGGYLYHGRVKALTDAARAAGLNKDEATAATEAVAEAPEEAAAAEAGAETKPAKAKASAEAKPAKAKVKKEPKAKPEEKPEASVKEKPSAKEE
jgi:large subunit ribosomal protein L18